MLIWQVKQQRHSLISAADSSWGRIIIIWILHKIHLFALHLRTEFPNEFVHNCNIIVSGDSFIELLFV